MSKKDDLIAALGGGPFEWDAGGPDKWAALWPVDQHHFPVMMLFGEDEHVKALCDFLNSEDE